MQKALHGKAKKKRFHDAIQIDTFVSTFMLPDRYTEESLEVKQAIIDCNEKEIFRSSLIQCYIYEDWTHFARFYAFAEFFFQFSFVALLMTQFWHTN